MILQLFTTHVRTIVFFLIVVGCLSVASVVEASYTEIDAYISPAGVVTLTPPSGSLVNNLYTVLGNFPVSTSTISTACNFPLSCTPAVFNGASIEDGYANNGATTNDGSYWVQWYMDTATSTLYYFTAQRIGGSWYGSLGSTTVEVFCSTCTRFVSHNPSAGENVATSTFTIVNEEVYVSEDDYWSGHTFFKYTYTNFSNSELSETYEQQILNDATSTFNFAIRKVTESGTYSVVTEIYTDSWFSFRDSKILQNFNFYSNSTSTIEDMIGDTKDILSDIYGGITCSFNFTSFGTAGFDCLLDYLWATVVPPPDTLSTLVQTKTNEVLLLPPFGYAKRIADILSATTTGSSSIALNISFPTSSPLSGHTLNLDASQGINDALAYIANVSVPTIDGNPYDTFLMYWERMWWIIFALWLLKEIYGLNIIYSQPKKEQLNNQE